ncbi:MAG: 4-(cytidine 5'-diphospho)-2-C-methyl-D-erythritol kinase [Acidobacteria bacterium]|nr:MAG: 4-(cytidine 5'-diphospho)-2-C-methyl-D-erythritol kinase [Acidobacteriota bacterium]
MTITFRSYAKINLTLDVLGRRADGYHEVRTILQSIALHDHITLERIDGGIEVICPDRSIPTDERNIVYRAAALVRERADIAAGVRIHISKRIPVGAGLGGGSSNAAVTLLGLERIWNLSWSPEEWLDLGATLGADVPFFFYGGAALGVGRGSEVYPLPDIRLDHLLIVWPMISVSTAEVYAALDGRWLTKSPPRSNITVSCETAWRAWGYPHRLLGQAIQAGAGGNDLTEVVGARYPEVNRAMERLRQFRTRCIRMSGSGSAVYAVFATDEDLQEAAEALSGEPWRIIQTRTIGRAEYWETLIEKKGTQGAVAPRQR